MKIDEELNELFHGFIQRWKDTFWKESLARAIDWYVHSNALTEIAEGSIVLTQLALETLAWTYFITDQTGQHLGKYRKKKAADRLRVLLVGLSIPIEIPEEMIHLNKAKQVFSSLDGLIFSPSFGTGLSTLHKRARRIWPT